jgi:cell volume regulation protein A
MTLSIIITLCILLLLAYFFDVTSSKTRIPSVLLFLGLGLFMKEVVKWVHVDSIPNLEPLLPVLGTIGLILIVLEGSLELQIDKTKIPWVTRIAFISIISIFIFSFGLAYLFDYYSHCGIKNGLANAIPYSVISSAIAIPSSRFLNKSNKDFITYESSLSDIFGVLFFNFIVLNESIDTSSVTEFSFEILLVLLVTLISTIGLSFLLSNIKHHVKFIPIILIIILLYVVAKSFHLPALIMIMILGIFLNNINRLTWVKFLEKLKPNILIREVTKFRELTNEIAFLIRALFFILFGFLLKYENLFNLEMIMWSIGITVSILILRIIILFAFRFDLFPLMFIAPRGLITILLFVSIPDNQLVSFNTKSMIIQVILFTSLMMMLGVMFSSKKEENLELNQEEEE